MVNLFQAAADILSLVAVLLKVHVEMITSTFRVNWALKLTNNPTAS